MKKFIITALLIGAKFLLKRVLKFIDNNTEVNGEQVTDDNNGTKGIS